jgi:hypothetical protein
MTLHEMVDTVTTKLKEGMETSPLFPYDKKTPLDNRRKPHMLDMALKHNVTYLVSPDIQYFELGNPSAEQKTPHYHILEDAKIIMFPKRGTNKSRGSQRLIGRKSQRDYGLVSYRQTQKGTRTGLVQEYRQNMTRNYDGTIVTVTTQPREFKKRLMVTVKNKRNWRTNQHYKYIERILTEITPEIANAIGAKVRTDSSNLLDGNELSGFLNEDYQMENTSYETFLESWRKS